MQTIKNYLDAEKRRREEEGEKGFSLIELIIVVVILGILAAIAIPIFLNIQDDARQNAADAIAGNAATQAAALLAQDTAATPTTPDLTNLLWDGAQMGDTDEGIVYTNATNDIEGICVTVHKEGKTGVAGPGCATTTP